MERRAKIHQLNEYSYCIDDAGESCCYVVCGSQKAALIDTVNGFENLHDIVREITDLPLVVINTHGHCDHIYGNTYFEEAYIHPDDVELHNQHFALKKEDVYENFKASGVSEEAFRAYQEDAPCPLKMIHENDIVDLGGIELLVIKIEGHTHGSIGLLDKQSGYFYTGDAVNKGQCWLQLEESRPLAVYAQSLRELEKYKAQIKEIHGGHSVLGYEPAFIDMMLEAVLTVIENNGEGDGTCEWFEGVSPTRKLPDGSLLLFDPKKLQ